MTLDQIESAPREELEALQLERLRTTVQRVLEGVAPMQERLRGAGIGGSEDIASLDDVHRLPFTLKSDLRDHYPYGLIAVPHDRLVRVHASSGTRGKPTVVGYTAGDLDVWTHVMARCLAMAGVGRGTVVHNAYGYGLFTGGLGFHQGAERLGARVVPISSGLTARQAMLLRDLGGEVLCCTPSYALHIAEELANAGVAPGELALEVGLFGAEPWTESMRGQIERELGLIALNIYGLSEIVGPGVSAECPEARSGLHVQEDHFLVEVVDPATGDPLPPGREGELVFTTLTKEALPLLRYRTGDIASLTVDPCTCGRTLARMSAVHGRRDDMLIVRGVNLYPSEVERVLLALDGIGAHYRLILRRDGALDELLVECEPSDSNVESAELGARAERALHDAMGIRMRVRVVERGGLPRSEGKAVRVIDERR